MTDDSSAPSARPDEAVEIPDTSVAPDAADDQGVVSRIRSRVAPLLETRVAPLLETSRGAVVSQARSVRGRMVGAEDKPTPLAVGIAGCLAVVGVGALLRRSRRSRRTSRRR